jgi:HD-like signal output (HDOD) protein
MLSSLRKLLGREPSAAMTSPPAVAAQAPTTAAAEAAQGPRATEPALDLRFSGWLLALEPREAAAPSAAEQQVLAHLAALTTAGRDAALVPRLPAALPRLLSLVRRPDASVRELASHLAGDQAMVGEVVRLANSPRYRPSREISSIEDAVQLLGQIGLEQLVSRVMLSPVFSARQGRFGREANTRLWDLADRCAHGCAFLRQPHGDGFDAYLAGMAAQTGWLVSLRALDRHYADAAPPDSLPFHQGLAALSARLALRIAQNWDFPAAAVAALDVHARKLPAAPDSLAHALALADRNAKRQLLGLPPEPRQAIEQAESPAERSLIAELYQLFDSTAAA